MINVAIIGLGLIGGSIALGLKAKYGTEVSIRGCDENETQVHLGLSLGVIDHSADSISECIQGADLIFLCIPVQSLCKHLEEVMLSPYLKEGAIITDVGSTKMQIVSVSRQFAAQSKGCFIAGHPMAGSHKSGVEAANERLFENAYYILTPDQGTDESKIQFLKEVLTSTRAKVVEMSPEEHDQVVGAISHLPHVLASALVEQIYDYHCENEWYLRLAAGGFRDITRIASSNPRMWRDITLSNKTFILKQLKDWQERMQRTVEMIESGDSATIEEFFAHAKQVRDGVIENKRGAIPSFYDLYVDVPDHPGIIGQITTLLGEHRISITSISILETREDILGVLRLSFRSKEDLETAKEVIGQVGYEVYERD